MRAKRGVYLSKREERQEMMTQQTKPDRASMIRVNHYCGPEFGFPGA
jgi:hypothetical protein